MNEAAVKLGQYLKEKRANAGLTQFQVASHLGYASPQFISNMERGCCFPPNKVLRGMMRLYKIPINEILEFLVEIETLRWRKTLSARRSK